jgi:hypothetical protein
MTFDKLWAFIQRNLRNTTIQNWTAAKGNLQDTFVITEITHHKVIVNTPNAQALQNVSMNDFEYMHQNWNAYCSGNITRTELCQHTRVSKYTMSILRHIETQLGIQIA